MNRYILIDLEQHTISNLNKVDTDFEINEVQTSSTSCYDRSDLLNNLLDTIKEMIATYQEENNDCCKICDECGHLMDEGFVVDDGFEYYCEEDCLHKHYSEKEWEEMYDDGNGDSYWTQWR